MPSKRQNILTSATIQDNLKEEYRTLILGEETKSQDFLYFNDNREIQTVSTLAQVFFCYMIHFFEKIKF